MRKYRASQPGTSAKFPGMGLVWVKTKMRKIHKKIPNKNQAKSPDFAEKQEIFGVSVQNRYLWKALRRKGVINLLPIL